MAPSTKLVLLLLAFLILVVQAQGARPAASRKNPNKCAASSVAVEQRNTGEKAGFDPVFEVAVRNTCGCAVRAVYIRSEGFASSVAVDPRLFRRDGRDYLVGDGSRIEPNSAVQFRYSWDRAFRMTAAAVHDDCSCSEILRCSSNRSTAALTDFTANPKDRFLLGRRFRHAGADKPSPRFALYHHL